MSDRARPHSVVGAVTAMATIGGAAGAAALAFWLWPASIHIVDWPRSGPHRVAVFSPLRELWVSVAGVGLVALVALVASLRRRDGLARLAWVVAPLNMLWVWTTPYWPWLPDRWPLLAALAGPLRWMFALLAVWGVASRLAGPMRLDHIRPGRRTVFVASLGLYVLFGLRTLSTTGLGGDEPHYLVITQSLILDRDLRIENNHQQGDYRPYFAGVLRPDYMTRGRDGEIYSIHAPGLSVLLIPGFLLAGAVGAIVTMSAIAALGALAIFELASLVAGPAAALATWAVVSLSIPMVPHAWALFPEGAGMAIVAWGLVWATRAGESSMRAWLWRGCCLAWLPWLHTKFSVLLAGLALILLWRLRRSWTSAAVALAPSVVSGLAWLASFYVIYGTLSPEAPYGDYAARFVRLENIPRSLLGLAFDQKFGLLVHAPVFAVALPGFWVLCRDPRWRPSALATLGLAAAFALSSARLYMWWGGSSAPARFLVPLAPCFAAAIAVALDRPSTRAVATTYRVAALVSVAVGVAGAIGTRYYLLYSEPHGFSRILLGLQGSAPLVNGLPTFTQPEWLAPAAALAPWAAAVILALGAGWLVARVGASPYWITCAEISAFAVMASALVSSFAPAVRAETATRGDLSLIDRFDPVRTRAFDYRRLQRLTPPEWLAAATLTFDREPGSEPDGRGRLTPVLRLPAGVYEARVWSEGARVPGTALLAVTGEEHVLARAEAPLPNPAALRVALPVAMPALWVQSSEIETARVVRRVEIEARSVDALSDRPNLDVAAVEAVAGPVGSYVAYLGAGAFPEGGVFWTRGQETARLLLVPAGGSTLALVLHVGPRAVRVRIRVGEAEQIVALGAEETRTVRVPLPPGAVVTTVEVQADASFRPVDVDPSSADARQLGCQVRLVLE